MKDGKLAMGPSFRIRHSTKVLLASFFPTTVQLPNQDVSGDDDDQTHLGAAQTQLFWSYYALFWVKTNCRVSTC